jgi:alkanesulfonate monooxygenase SsuD/methylene tetrahydromethanopterin reductase-like flavin-dependent oxidoreductase (luciferase family)
MQAERGQDLGTYGYAADLKQVADDGSLDFMDLAYLEGSGACVLGTPEECIETCKRYEAAGVDQLLCLVNPYKIPHESVLQTIQLMGEHVIPEFR